MAEVGEKNIADQNWYRIRQSIYVLLESLDVGSGKNNSENVKRQKLRERGWVSIFKQRDQNEIEEFLQDYIEVLSSEFRTIMHLGEKELEQRKDDL